MQAVSRKKYHEVKRNPSLTLVRQKTGKTRVSSFSRFIMLSLLLTAVVFVNVSQRVTIAQDVSSCEKLETLIRAEETRQEKLLLDVVALKSPDRIEKVAVERLGMIPPVEICYLTLPKEVEETEASILAQTGSGTDRSGPSKGISTAFQLYPNIAQTKGKGF